MAKRITNWTKFEAQRLAILAEAERLCVPGCFTPTWQRLYGRKVA